MSSSIDEQILRAAKEVVVKFIETGRVSPTAFPEIFQNIYTAIENSVKRTENSSDADNQPSE